MTWKIKKKLKEIAGEERGIHIKDPGGKINVCLVFPNTYYLGMSNLGFTSIYSYLNSFHDVFCERAFLPDTGRAADLPRIPVYTLETTRRLTDFDMVGFSVSFENDYLNIVRILKRAGIPPLRSERDDRSPVIFSGGFAPSQNPEVLGEICDFIVLGDGEPPLEKILDLLGGGHLPRAEFLEKAASFEGVYVPSLYEPAYDSEGSFLGFTGEGERTDPAVSDLNRYPAYTTVFTERTEFGDMFLVEIARGCVKKCFFCGVSHRPGRFRCLDVRVIKELVRNGLADRSRVGLVGSAVLDHPQFMEIARFVLEEGGTISPASIRADMVDGEVARVLQKSGVKSAALAPETGDEERRRSVGKGISDDAFFEATRLLHDSGVENVKFYFIAGLPGTTEEEDIHATVTFVKRLNHHVRVSRGKASGPRVIVSMAGFVPKGRTPFQFSPFPGVERLKSTYGKIRRALQREGRVRCEVDVPKYSYLQALFSVGDRRVSKVLARWDTKSDVMTHFNLSPVNPDFFVMREKDGTEILPWDGVFREYGKDTLLRQYRGITFR